MPVSIAFFIYFFPLPLLASVVFVPLRSISFIATTPAPGRRHPQSLIHCARVVGTLRFPKHQPLLASTHPSFAMMAMGHQSNGDSRR